MKFCLGHRLVPFLLMLAGTALHIGCGGGGGSAPAPTPPDPAALTSLAVSAGTLSPAFAPEITAYTLSNLFTANPSVNLTVSASNPDASLTLRLNGTPLPTRTAQLPPGVSTLTIEVKAGTELPAKTYTITSATFAPNVQVAVLDSINGSPVADALLTVADAAGTVLQTGIPVDASGLASLGLDRSRTYDLSAVGPGTAQSLRIGFDPNREDVLSLTCHPLGMINMPAKAARFTALSYGPNGTTWLPVTQGAIRDSFANLKRLKVTAEGTAGISATYSSGFGMGLAVDSTTSEWAMTRPLLVEENSTPIPGTSRFRSTMQLELPFSQGPEANHVIDLVAYDVANNRTEQKIPVTLTDAQPDLTQQDLSALKPANVQVQLLTIGATEDIFVSDPGPGLGGSLHPAAAGVTRVAAVMFDLPTASGYGSALITGFEVWRATDGGPFSKVGIQQFARLTPASQLVYGDVDPLFQDGRTYSYKVRPFTANTTHNGGYAQESAVISAKFLPPFTTRLSAPAHGAIATTTTPSFSFALSNPALFDPAVSDFLYFDFFARPKEGTDPISYLGYRYNFALARFEIAPAWLPAAPGQVTIDASHSLITFAGPVNYFQAGVTYEWNIFANGTRDNACNFRKYYFPLGDPTSTSFGYASSKGSNSGKKFGAVNGAFTLILDPAAH